MRAHLPELIGKLNSSCGADELWDLKQKKPHYCPLTSKRIMEPLDFVCFYKNRVKARSNY